MTRYRRLTREERYQIEALQKSGMRVREIARQLNRDPATISRELRKLGISSPYCAEKADQWSVQVRAAPHPELQRIRGGLERTVRKQIQLDWSPEQICGRLKREKKTSLSHQTIYRYLKRDRESGGTLWKHLRILRKQRKDKMPRWKPNPLKNRTPIQERPSIVEQRNRLGDYERDTLMGQFNGPMLLTAVDRTSRLTKLAWIPRKCSRLVHRATVRMLKKEPLETITNDNGTEFSQHHQTADRLNVKVYFSSSYRAWERGTNENTNGLLRQYLHKKKPIPPLSSRDLRQLEQKLNSRPRKCLGFRTPIEVHRALKSSVLR